MLSEPRAIYFSTELEFPPFEPFRITKDEVRALYNSLFGDLEPRYSNLNLQAEKPVLSSRRGNGRSRCEIGDHTILIEEDATNVTLEDFTDIVLNVIRSLGQSCPPFFFQRCKIHCLATPHGAGDSLELLAGRVANVLGKIDPFERSPSFFGVRFRFLPESDEPSEGATDVAQRNQPEEGFAAVRFETYSNNPEQVWMEIESNYPCTPVITTNDTNRIEANITRTYVFLSEKCKRFLDQFDSPREGENT
jgi:hypothetical protein